MNLTAVQLVSLRLKAQFPLNAGGTTPQPVVSRLAGIQAQDYAGAKWSFGALHHYNDAAAETVR